MPIESVQYGGFRGLVFVGAQGGTIITIDITNGLEIVGTVNVGANVSRMRLDDTTGVLYVTYSNETGDQIGLRLYETRNDMNVLREFELDRAAGPLDIDMLAGLAYVGRTSAAVGRGGLSVIDVVRDTVIRYSGEAFGSAMTELVHSPAR